MTAAEYTQQVQDLKTAYEAKIAGPPPLTGVALATATQQYQQAVTLLTRQYTSTA